MTPEQQRKFRLAIWHANEACLRYAVGDDEMVDYHCMASREALQTIVPDRVTPDLGPDDLADICADLDALVVAA